MQAGLAVHLKRISFYSHRSPYTTTTTNTTTHQHHHYHHQNLHIINIFTTITTSSIPWPTFIYWTTLGTTFMRNLCFRLKKLSFSWCFSFCRFISFFLSFLLFWVSFIFSAIIFIALIPFCIFSFGMDVRVPSCRIYLYIYKVCFKFILRLAIFPPFSLTEKYPEINVLNQDKDHPHLSVLHDTCYSGMVWHFPLSL